jgi:uracil-DNA glycosylase family 4
VPGVPLVAGTQPPYTGLIVGEAPGRDEHVKRCPFVGWAGSFLRGELANLLSRSKQEKVFLTNAFQQWPICSHRIQTPNQAMVNSHQRLLKADISACAGPKAILAVGRIALYAVTGNAAYLNQRTWPMYKLVARTPYSSAPGLAQGAAAIPVIAVYHPRYVRVQQHSALLQPWRRSILKFGGLI